VHQFWIVDQLLEGILSGGHECTGMSVELVQLYEEEAI